MSVQNQAHIPKTKEQYSKNIKILKYQLQKLQQEIKTIKGKISTSHSIDNDRLLALRFAKQCRIRKFTPQMVFRFADTLYEKEIDQTSFRSVLKTMGFNLSQDEVRKITLLIDQDMSGKLTHQQFIEYLQAFNINTETPQRKIIKGIKNGGIKNISEIIGKDRMLDWQQFYKYMKQKFPQMKQKQLIKIFNKLDPNNTGKIPFSELKKLLQKLLNEQQSAIKKPKKKQIQRKQSKLQISKIDASSLQNKLYALIRYRKSKSKLFHMMQFKKIGQKLKQKQSFINLFKQIDSNKIGSFMIVDIIRYYLPKKNEKETYKTVYQLMNHKLLLDNSTVQQFLYNKGFRDDSFLTEEQFCRILFEQFQIQEYYSKKMYKQIQDQLPQDDKRVRSTNVISKFKQNNKDQSNKPDLNDLITLNYFGTKQQHFYRKGMGSIVFSPILALKFCLFLQSQIIANNRKQWMDPQFGVSNEDKTGFISLTGRNISDVDLGIDQDDLAWNRAESLGMKQFYSNYNQKAYKIGKVHNPQFVSGLTMLPQYFSNVLWNEPQNIKSSIQKLTEQQLVDVFSGIYPKAFHYFNKYGIYVFRYFVQNRFVYVLVDNYIPTMTSKQIIFSSSSESWISLIEKGYAKLQGSYSNMLQRQSIYEVIYELNHLCPLDRIVPPDLTNSNQLRTQSQNFWKDLQRIFNNNPNILISCFNDSNKIKLTCLKKQTQLVGQQSVQIISVLEIQNKQSKNNHKSHRLLILKLGKNKTIDDKQWNESWSKYIPNNKYDKNLNKIEKILKQRKQAKVLAELQMKNVFVINYKRFRSLYDRIYYLENLQNSKWNSKMTLDRMLTQGYHYSSEFRLQSRMKSQVILALLKRVQAPKNIYIEIGLKNKPPMIRKRSTQDFIFINIPEIEANLEYIISVYCQQEIIDFYLTFHLETKDFKVWKSNGPAIFHDSHRQQDVYKQYKDADKNVKQYLETKLFNVQAKKGGTGCCG